MTAMNALDEKAPALEDQADGPLRRTPDNRARERATHVVGDQSAVIAFLENPASHGLDPLLEQVERVDTHGAIVFLAGTKAYKIKRAVCFPFMDLSTLARREEACKSEITIGRPTAPEIYIDTIAITRSRTGRLTINGGGEPIEWAVEMHRFDRGCTFDRLAAAGRLSPEDIESAVDAIIAFQARAPERRAGDWLSDLASYIEQNDQSFHEAQRLFPRVKAEELRSRSQAALADLESLVLKRGEDQRVRRCHGDLHLRNIVKLKQGVRLFDAIEFDDRIATGDVLYDLAFLLMNLDEAGHRGLANHALNHFLSHTKSGRDFDGLRALPLYLSVRAGLRAKISAMTAGHLSGDAAKALEAEARLFFDYALDVLEPRDVSLTVIGGLSGTGKSAVARALAPGLGGTPGAVVLRSDVVRKAMAGVAPETHLDASAYTASATNEVYETLGRRAKTALEAGHAVIVDAVF
ncbi:MAG: AAA family ATPase, partial [Devosiaceae bacterium]|nr:AAA family ATPase [Devosiaceae bacterium MH13]